MKYLIIKDDLQGNIWHAIKRNFNDEKRIDVVVDDIMNILLKACEKKEIGSVEQKPSKKVEIDIGDAIRIIESTNYLVVKSNKSFIHLQEAIEKAESEDGIDKKLPDDRIDQLEKRVEGLESLIDRDRKEHIEIVAALKKEFSDQVKLLKDEYDLHYDTNKKIQQLQVQVYTFDKKLNSARVCPDNNNIYFDIDD